MFNKVLLSSLPQPLEDETLASLVARSSYIYGLSHGCMAGIITGQRYSIHPQYTKYVPQIAEQWHIDTKTILQNHTFLPLISPFCEPWLYDRLIDWMLGNISNQLRISYFVLKSISMHRTYRHCPECWREQNIAQNGSLGWLRLWFIPQCSICDKHFCALHDTGQPIRNAHGNMRYIDCSDIDQQSSCIQLTKSFDLRDVEISTTASSLLKHTIDERPLPEQWEKYWILRLKGLSNDSICRAIDNYWGKDYLDALGVMCKDKYFVKGTKCRAWWRHLILLKALDPNANLVDTVHMVSSIPI